jgi:hypothetical protein
MQATPTEIAELDNDRCHGQSHVLFLAPGPGVTSLPEAILPFACLVLSSRSANCPHACTHAVAAGLPRAWILKSCLICMKADHVSWLKSVPNKIQGRVFLVSQLPG